MMMRRAEPYHKPAAFWPKHETVATVIAIAAVIEGNAFSRKLFASIAAKFSSTGDTFETENL